MKEESEMNNWIDILDVNDIPRLGARVVRHGKFDIAVFRNAADEIFALEDRCPHKGGPLSQGIVHGKSVTCPLHNWVIGLADGLAQGADKGSVKTYPLQVENGRLLIDTSALTVKTKAA